MKKGEWEGGKGSSRRGSNDKTYRDNWDEIFRKNKQDNDRYLEQLRSNGIEPASKKHYGDNDSGNKDI